MKPQRAKSCNAHHGGARNNPQSRAVLNWWFARGGVEQRVAAQLQRHLQHLASCGVPPSPTCQGSSQLESVRRLLRCALRATAFIHSFPLSLLSPPALPLPRPPSRSLTHCTPPGSRHCLLHAATALLDIALAISQPFLPSRRLFATRDLSGARLCSPRPLRFPY